MGMLLLDPPPWRACVLCEHGADLDGQRVCEARAVVAPAAHKPVDLVRGTHGPCGPEAVHLSFPGLQA